MTNNSFLPRHLQDPIWDDGEDLCDHLFAVCEMYDEVGGYEYEYDPYSKRDEIHSYLYATGYFEGALIEEIVETYFSFSSDEESANYLQDLIVQAQEREHAQEIKEQEQMQDELLSDPEDTLRQLIRHPNRKKAA